MTLEMRFVVVAIVTLAACKAPSSAPHVNVTTVASASASAPVTANPAAVGLVSFEGPAASAVAKNDHGVELLSKGKVPEAIASLEAALAAAPDFVRARYNLACAHARAGDNDKARAELEAVYEADFVAIRAHADHDDDLAAFWKSAQGVALAARKVDYEARFNAAVKRGVPAILWDDGTGQRGRLAPRGLRVGVFDPDHGRFVAVAPPMRNAIDGFASSMLPYAVVVTGVVRDELGGDLDAGMSLEAVHVFPMSADGVALASVPLNVEPISAALHLDTAGMSLTASQSISLATTVDKYREVIETRFGGPTTTTLLGLSDKVPTLAHDGAVYMNIGYNHWGWIVTENNRAYTYRPHELVLPSGKTIAVPKAMAFYHAPARVIPSPQGDRVVLVWNAAVIECDGKQDIPGHYKMALVDTVAGTVTSLGDGNGAGHAAFRASGELYVQRGTRVEQITQAGATALPAHVLLVPPVVRDDACGP